MDNILALQEAIYNLPEVEIFAVLTGIIYVVLAARENIWCWSFGIVSAALWSFAAYDLYDLYVDAILQLYYVFVGIYGWVKWNKKVNNQQEVKIKTLPITQHIIYITLGISLTFLVGYFFDNYTAAVATYLDAFTTVFALFATYLVTQKILENWLYWIFIDSVYIYLYGSRGGYLFALLNIIFVVVAVIGFFRWRKTYLLEKSDRQNKLYVTKIESNN